MRSSLRGVCTVLIGAVAGCAPGTPQSVDVTTKVSALTGGCTTGQQCVLTIPVPEGSTPQDAILTATTSLAISNGVVVKTNTGSFGTVANVGTGQSSIGVSSQVGTPAKVGNVVSEGSVFLANNAVVNGSVTTGNTLTEQQGALVTGTITKHSVATDSSRKVTVTFQANAPAINLQPGAPPKVLAPGSYGSVTVNSRATLTLSTGTYLFASFDTEPQATLNLNEAAGPIFIYVQNTLLYKGTETQTGGDGAVFLGFFGTQAVSLQAPFRGTLVAPNAPVELTTQTAGFAGAFWGSNLQVDPNSPITGIGALLPPAASTGVSPTLNCVAQLSSTQFGAVFGYMNTTGATVTLGGGPHNMFSPGNADRGQPILFVPGAVPIAAFQTFAAGTSLAYTIGQQSVVASASTPACSAALTTALSQLFSEGADSQVIRNRAVAILANPKFGAWMTATKNNLAAQLTPFESSLLDAASLVSGNADLLGDPSLLTPAQLARIPTFLTTLLTNAAVTQLRLTGDALRGTPAAVPCKIVGTIDDQQPRQTIPPLAPQVGSLFAQVQAFSGLSVIQNVQATVTAVANGAQNTAVLAAPGLLLATFQPESALIGIQLSGAIPTGFLSAIGGAITGAIVGAAVGLAAGGPVGALYGAAAGAVVGAIACGTDPSICDNFLGDTCQNCTGGASDGELCGPNGICVDGCCSGNTVPTTMTSFLSGNGCPGAAPSCQRDFDCGTGLLCVQNCCVSPQAIAAQCTGNTCSTNADCRAGNTCQFGCCIGPCGINGPSCTQDPEPAMCGAPQISCPASETCTAGCCVFVIP